MKKITLVFVSVLALLAQPVMADLLGVANGRSANMDNMADMSVEGGYSQGERDDVDVTNMGVRFNFKASPDLMVFADVGQAKFSAFGSSETGTSFGAGAYYQLRDVVILENTDLALKGSYHSAEFKFDESIKFTELAIEAIVSGDQLSTTSFGWYANLGMHILDSDAEGADSENEVIIGGGVVGPLAFGDWYAGLDLIDEITFRFGVRYNLQ